ncbi:DegT/DnrJ/EryC1/StrS family aminotransferase [Candidatus Woesearchaeota archaeon]|nr:DegT/DnrJ/EryC1/StrS family aminotransferase [Candidatus Woesearchaeota archaeon]
MKSTSRNQYGGQRGLIENLLRAYSRCAHVRLVNRGNAAILSALTMAKEHLGKHPDKSLRKRKTVLVPDQGGWISFETYPPLLGFDVLTVKTDRGIIDLADLVEKSKQAAAFLVTSFAGYFAEQPIRDIADACHKNACLVIEDVSGAVGDATLCDGRIVDIIVGSFGEHKPVNNGYGGFVATNDKALFGAGSVIFSATNFHPEYTLLLEKLKEVPARLELLLGRQVQVKRDMKKLGVEVLHPPLRGLNVVVRPKDGTQQKAVLDYCTKEELKTIRCPKYIRVDEDAISIEIKRLP